MPSKKVEPVDANNEPEYKGHPINEELENGPMEKRSCTDILCCMLFIVFLGGMIGIASYSIKVGNPEIIGRGLDVDKKVCGVSPGYENYPYLYFTVPLKNYLSQTICVSSCTPVTTNTLSCKTNSLYANCVGTSEAAALAAGSNQQGKLWIYNNSPYLSRYCLPINSDYAATVLSDALDTQLLEEWFTDVKTAWPVIAVSAGAAFIIGLVYMILLRCCSGILTWGAILCFIGGTGVLGWRFYDSATSNTSASAASDNAKSQKIIAYILWGIAGLSAIGMLCLYNRIRLAIAIIKAASQYVRNTLSVFLIPPVMVIILAAWYTFWIYTSIYLLSSGSAVASGTTPITSISFDKPLKTYMIYQLVALLWVNAFVLASVQFIIASSVCLWYFSQGTGQGAGSTISKSVFRLFRYHFGSIAFGSLLVALIQTVRIILAYFQYQAKKLKGKEGKVVEFVFKCAQCYLACFERFIKFINKNAYIQIALTGKNFCRAAKDGFFLVLRNPLRIGALATIGGIFIFFGKVFIAAVTALGAYIFVTKYTPYSTQINNPFIITLLVFIFAYAIAAVFMTIYGLAADTILAAFIVDEELSKKKNAPARHCPDVLKDFIEKHGKKD